MLNLDTGQIEERVDPFEGQRESLEHMHSFVVNGVKYAGYCDRCGRQVHWDDRAISINKICGNIRVSVTHRRCL